MAVTFRALRWPPLRPLRAAARDCGSGGGERADVEMVVHISADRGSATVMSIPRDLDTALPACTGSQNRCRLGGPA